MIRIGLSLICAGVLSIHAQASTDPSDTTEPQRVENFQKALTSYYANKPTKLNNAALASRANRYILQCLPKTYQGIMKLIVYHESSGNQFAIGVNNGPKLPRQPVQFSEAVLQAKKLLAQGYSIDTGYAQINSQHFAKSDGFLAKLGYRVEDMFDPCTNLRAGAIIYSNAYYQYGDIKKALSAYNTGSPTKGFSNGYVEKVLGNK